jgi:hypothetical protein
LFLKSELLAAVAEIMLMIQVAAAAVFGNPHHTPSQPYNIGRGSSFPGNQARTPSQLASLNAYSDILADWCNFGDPVCAVGSEPVNITAHWSYYEEYSDVAAKWIVATALGLGGELDLDRTGRNQSVVLGGNSTRREGDDDDSGGEEDGAMHLRVFGGWAGILVLVAAVIWL